MTFDTLLKLRKLFAILVAAVAVVLLVVTGFVVHSLQQSRQRYYANAEETSRNLAISLENFLHSHFQEVDLALLRAAEDYRLRRQQGRFADAEFSAYLRSLKERIPHARAIRGADAGGRLLWGDEVDPAKPINLGIREFFQRARGERALIFGVPVKSRISGEWVLPVVRALTAPDASFAGIAYVNIDVARLNELFGSLNMGPHGVITLLDTSHRMLHRYPNVEEGVIGQPLRLSAATEAVLDSGRKSASYRAVSAIDGNERIYSVERIGAYPVYVLVGLSSEDVLVPWQREARNAGLFLAVLVLLAGALLLGVRLALQRQYQALEQLVLKDRELQGSLSALRLSETRWRSLTEGLPQMVWTVTPELRFNFLSHHWGNYRRCGSGGSADGAAPRPGDDWAAIVEPGQQSAAEAAWQLAASSGNFRCESRLRRGDGAWRVFDHHALAQRDAGGAILGWVGSSTDVTETRAAHDALLQAKEAALSAGRAKSEFVANMSHEIRTPMNAVLGMLRLLQQTALDSRQRDYSSKAEAAARALLGLLNDILDFSKVEAGKLVLDPHPFSIDRLLRELGVVLAANLGARQLELLFDIDPALPDQVIGDALRLQQILLNLSGNAIKFTESGEVMLTVRLLERRGATLAIGFAIRDTGIGISAEQCARIFDGFSQAEASTARRYGGSGLGLAISQRLVQLMGGTLRVDSVAGQGSTFEFSVALQAAPALPAAAAATDSAAATAAGQPALRQLDCLLVDDNASARQVLGTMAASFGWRVEAVATGLEALAAVAARGPQRPYNLVLVDWRMPGLDGWDTCSQLRQMAPAGVTTLIVMVGAYDREQLAQREGQPGALLDGVLVKPVTASMLFDAVADAGRERPAAAAPVQPPAHQRLLGLRLLLVEDNPTNQQVASELLGNDGAAVTVAGGGRAALALLEAAATLPDLILMDIQMPDMDGYAATAAIHARLGERAPPVIAMTANAMPSDRVAALAAGMVDHVGKPFDLDQLVSVILQHARGVPAGVSAGVSAGISAGISASVPARGGAPADGSAALRRMGGNVELYRRALASFVSEARRIAEQLDQARAGDQREAAMPLLHTLKGLCGTVGLDALALQAASAETRFGGGADWEALDGVLAAVEPALLTVRGWQAAA